MNLSFLFFFVLSWVFVRFSFFLLFLGPWVLRSCVLKLLFFLLPFFPFPLILSPTTPNPYNPTPPFPPFLSTLPRRKSSTRRETESPTLPRFTIKHLAILSSSTVGGACVLFFCGEGLIEGKKREGEGEGEGGIVWWRMGCC